MSTLPLVRARAVGVRRYGLRKHVVMCSMCVRVHQRGAPGLENNNYRLGVVSNVCLTQTLSPMRPVTSRSRWPCFPEGNSEGHGSPELVHTEPPPLCVCVCVLRVQFKTNSVAVMSIIGVITGLCSHGKPGKSHGIRK